MLLAGCNKWASCHSSHEEPRHLFGKEIGGILNFASHALRKRRGMMSVRGQGELPFLQLVLPLTTRIDTHCSQQSARGARFLRWAMGVLLNLHANCSRFAPKPATPSRLLPIRSNIVLTHIW